MKLISQMEKVVRDRCGKNEVLAEAIISDLKAIMSGGKAETDRALAHHSPQGLSVMAGANPGHDQGLFKGRGPYGGRSGRVRVEPPSNIVEDTSANGEPQVRRHHPDL